MKRLRVGSEKEAEMGTKIINCMQHMNLPLTNRPAHCELCATDVAAAGVQIIDRKSTQVGGVTVTTTFGRLGANR